MDMKKNYSPEQEAYLRDDLLGKNSCRRRSAVPHSDDACVEIKRKRLKDCGDSL